MRVSIKRWGINGEGIGYLKRKPVFVDGAMPGELAEIEITEENERYAKGKLIRILEASARRRKPMCPSYESCGGCTLMHADSKGQVRMKEQILKEALKKYAHYTGSVEPLRKNPNALAYRNAAKLPLGKKDGKIVTGMYESGTTRFVPIERCLIHSKPLESVKNHLVELFNKYELPVWDKDSKDELLALVLKEYNGKVYVVLVTTPEMKLPEALIRDMQNIEELAGIWQSEKSRSQKISADIFGESVRHLAGSETIDLNLDGLNLKMKPRSFFQLNTAQAQNLYDKVVSLIPENTGLMVEAYCGIGAISLLAKNRAEKIIGIESVEDAIDSAEINAALNRADHVSFICNDAAAQLKKISKAEHVDVLVVDPPRTGLGKQMAEAVLEAKPERIIYVSCNPATLSKDLNLLSKMYKIKEVTPFDMFSQTPHIESVTLLELKNRKQPVSKKA